jgi:hypothetical protein
MLRSMRVKPLELTIVSAGDAIEVPVWDENDPAVRAQRNLDGSIWAYTYANGAARWMHVPGVASFRFGSRSEEAVVVPEPATPPISLEVIEDTFQRAVLPMALHAHGGEAVHGSGVITEGDVVAFCGPSRSGKSTFAYGLHRRGYQVWADDTIAFEAAAELVQAVPYPHRLRIRADAAEYFDLDELRKRDTSSWTALEQAQEEPARLAAIILLGPTPQSPAPVDSERLTPAQALTAVIENAYWFRLDEAERSRQMIETYLALAAQVPVYRLRFRADFDQFPVVLDHVEALIQEVGA